MRRMIPLKLINVIMSLLPFSNKVEYVGDQVKIKADVEVEGLTSKGIANTGALANIGDVAVTGDISASGHITGDVVHTMPAPSSTTLTDEEFSKVIGGVFIIGSFLGLQNPILCTPTFFGGIYVGVIISGTTIGAYTLNSTNKVIAKRTTGTPSYNLENLNQVNGKQIPAFPAESGSFTYKCVDGVLTWVAD